MNIAFDGGLFAEDHQDDHLLVLLCATTGDVPVLWDDAIIERRIQHRKGALLIATMRNMMVPLRVTRHAARPAIDAGAFDRAAACAIDAPTGQRIIEGRISVPTAPHAASPGRLGALITFAKLGAISEAGLDGEDSCAVHLWASTEGGPAGFKVLKQWAEPCL